MLHAQFGAKIFFQLDLLQNIISKGFTRTAATWNQQLTDIPRKIFCPFDLRVVPKYLKTNVSAGICRQIILVLRLISRLLLSKDLG